MKRVHIVGASGYAAADLIRILGAHPDVELVTLESASSAGKPVHEAFRVLARENRRFDPPGRTLETCTPGDIAILAGGAERAREVAPGLRAAGVRLLDLSDAFRVGTPGAVYGFSERYPEAIATAEIVANPGCYPTAGLLALWPMAEFAGRILQIVIDAKSGITGAGRNPALSSMYAEVDGDVRVYGIPRHRHGAELSQELAAMGIAAPYAFTPHVVPLSRGMLADVYIISRTPLHEDDVRAAFERKYAGSPFVHVLESGRVPYLPALTGTNEAHLAISVRDGVVHLMCGIDNLGKGAAGQAVQNLNIMSGFPQETGLGHRIAVS